MPVGLELALVTFTCCGLGLGLVTKGLELRLFKMAEFPTQLITGTRYAGLDGIFCIFNCRTELHNYFDAISKIHTSRN